MSPTAIYLHIPFCHRRCFYCDFPIKVIGDRRHGGNFPLVDRYLEVLTAEIRATPPNDKAIETLFLGGGTPSLLTVSQLESLLNVIQQHFTLLPTAEVSIEIDPGTFDRAQLAGYRDLGVNRFSLGVQAFQASLLAGAGRSHTLAEVYTAIDLIHQTQIKNWSLDLISGLPQQSQADWDWSLQEAIAAQPAHLSLYDLVLEPQTVFGKRYPSGEFPFPPEDLSADLYRISHDRLAQAGYQHYEISNYAQPTYQCRHNRIYWTNQAYYGFGMGATSYVDQRRVDRPRVLADYEAWVQRYCQEGADFWLNHAVDTANDRFLDTLMLGLRLQEGVDLQPLATLYPQQVDRLLKALIPYENRGWVRVTFPEPENEREGQAKDGQIKDGQDSDRPYPRVQLTDPEGFLFSNQVLSTIFALAA
ncbi:MAG: radical SAM family heme chaperone HemW [Prochlorotrichaceae cyanobacterium]